jgi:hypothetical protein
MKLSKRLSSSGATRPGFLDVLTAAVLLAILLWASWKQFPAYDNDHPAAIPAVSASPSATP